ncbi:hypothetical protein AA14337_0742 [Acetobacter malorum DSM 14337]|uniref:Uncharacterized protein n=1 Tax=Acetobacter malorum DSM 14337 TaxID=1307910 RepID=A0ABQ0PP62_9PROT|nr:hypothetical protein [Acetobacter malorum]KXV08745.1 hypothetical protein AD930_03815 [Acetobacter malorum]GBQ77187.1 hypothetical protein AA14337_0742 [Acetobacter malorum DSM 14337]
MMTYFLEILALCISVVVLVSSGYKVFYSIVYGEGSFGVNIIYKFLLLVSFIGFLWSLYLVVTFKPEVPVDNEKPSRVCGTVLKLWQQKSGGGGDLFHTDPVTTDWVMGYRVDGEVKSVYLTNAEYASIKEGDIVTISHEKTDLVYGYTGLPVWTDVVKPGCDNK